MDIVIPVAEEVANPTLKYAVETIRRFAPNLRVVMIGFTMPYAKPYGDLADFAIPLNQDLEDLVGNTNRAMHKACVSDQITDPFIWSNDDIYWRRAVSLEELIVTSRTAKGKVPQRAPYSRPKGLYARMDETTRGVLENHKPTPLMDWDYERHAPLIVEKERMLKALVLGGNKRTVYGNLAIYEGVTSATPPIRRDCKLWRRSDQGLPIEVEPFFSTGNSFPIDELQRRIAADASTTTVTTTITTSAGASLTS